MRSRLMLHRIHSPGILAFSRNAIWLGLPWSYLPLSMICRPRLSLHHHACQVSPPSSIGRSPWERTVSPSMFDCTALDKACTASAQFWRCSRRARWRWNARTRRRLMKSSSYGTSSVLATAMVTFAESYSKLITPSSIVSLRAH